MVYLAGHAGRFAAPRPASRATLPTNLPSTKRSGAGSQRRGGRHRAGPPRKGSYMFSISTSPKPEHDTCVAPSIRRAKSYVTRFCRIDFSIAAMIVSAASVQPR